ncbi:MAG TPA: LuxR C-terminal-related transcriptional regulator [Solirubrobacteraceae bacterium]|nr:LuxR C-terminal-related transcriptional regulator [Solirubrobacteraceae bacterium]
MSSTDATRCALCWPSYRIERTRRLELDPFDRDELSEALADILGERPAPGLVERLHARAEGNPLYTEELLAANLDGRGPAPQSLRDAFMLRIERLSPAAQRAARAIAVGRALEQPAISAVTGLGTPELQDALREAVAEQVLVARDEDCLTFRHELLREALYDDLLPGERSELHSAVAQAFERQAALEPEERIELAASIAAHYGSAGDQPAALQASVRAARAAWEVHAAAETARLAERALELWARVPDAPDVAGISEVDLLVLAARARLAFPEPLRAEQLTKRALDRIDPAGDPRCYASVLAILARTQWTLNRGLEAVETAKRALALVPVERGGEERAELLGLLARWEFLRGRFRDSVHDAQEALDAARAAGDEVTEGHILNTLGMAEVLLGNADGGAERLHRAIELFERHDETDNAAYTYCNLADMMLIVGRTEEALTTAHEALRAIPARVRQSNHWLVMTMSEMAFAAGDWATSASHLGPQPTEVVGRHLIYRLLREAELALGLGDLERAAGRLEQAQPLVASSAEPQYIGALGVLAGELHRRRYDLPAARAAVAQALDRIELCTDDVMRVANLSAVGVRIEADIAQRARDLRERADERDALTRARFHMDRLKASADEGGPVPGAWKLTGLAELARARGRSDVKLWIKAAESWDQLGRPYEVALMQWRGTEAAVLAGDRKLASELASEAIETARRLGSRWLSDELQALARRGRLSVGAGEPAAAQNGEPATTEEDPFGLTAREREVLALIAQGATNRQIGNALFMAEKTASVHVSRILAKLRVQSRTQAAAVAHRMGLATTARGTTAAGPVEAKPR